jgi:hypothetical protein
MAAAVAKGKANLDLNAIEVYFHCLALFLPWVLLAAVTVYLVASGQMPQMSGPGYVWSAAALVGAGLVISPAIGGIVPLGIGSPESGSPPAVAQWIVDAFGTYLGTYGVAVFAGFVEGGALGYWAHYLTRPASPPRAPAVVGRPAVAPVAVGTQSPTFRATPAVDPAAQLPTSQDQVILWSPGDSYPPGTIVLYRDRRWVVRTGHDSIAGVPPPNDSTSWLQAPG